MHGVAIDTDDSDCYFLYDDGAHDYDGPQSTAAQMDITRDGVVVHSVGSAANTDGMHS